MEQILQDALFLANVCNTLQISGYLKQELIDEHPALIEHINEATARIFAATQTTQAVVKPLAADSEQTTRKIKNARYCIKCGGWLFREGIDRQPTKRTTDEVTTCPKCGRDEFWGGRCHVVGCGSKTN